MSKKTGFLSVTLVAGLATGLLAPHYTGLTVNAAPSLNPYGTVQAEIDFERDIKEVYTEGDIQGVSLESGNYFQMRTVNFSQGVSRIGVTVKADTMGKLEIHKGGKDGEVVGSIKINNTNGEYKNFSSPVTGLEGTETITFVQSVGSSMVDSWNAEPGAVTEQPGVTVEQPAVDDSESRYDKVEAEACTKSDKAMTTPNKKAVMITEGEYILAKDADFSEGLAGFYVNAGSSAAQSSMAIYIDEIKGDALATIAVTNKDTAELSAKFASDIKGKHDVYFVAKKGMVTIDSLQAIKATGEVASEEPVVEEPTSEEPVVEEPVVEQPVTGDTVNAYDMVQAEASSEFKNAMISPKKDEVAMLPGGYIAIENVDFSRKTDGIFVYTRAEKQPGLKLNVYLDDMNGKPIATITAHGMNAIKESGARITTDITGTHKVYIVSDSENAKNITIDSWKLSEKKTGEPTSEEPVVEQPVEEPTSEEPVVEQPVSGDTVNPYDKVEAEKCTKIENGMKTPSKNAVLVRKDGYIYVENVDFSKGIDGIFVNVESSTKSTIDVYLDKMSGNALAQIVVTPDKKTNGVKLSSDVKGTHSVYFVVKGDSVTIDSWYALQGHKTEE
ncbi:MAG: carbohydrate-binding protein, partial [Eubacterium sp.]|nr:carbohydrate-binding protein [Eubacterium sp.]